MRGEVGVDRTMFYQVLALKYLTFDSAAAVDRPER